MKNCFKNPLFVCYSDNLGEHMRLRRRQLGLFQKEVAKLIGVCEDTIRFWESGHAKPMINHFPAIIRFLDYNPFLNGSMTQNERLQSYRTSHGLSYKKLGKMLGVDASTVRSWELQESLPNRNSLNKLEQIV